MNVDQNVFFREATLRICSSLDIETALKRCFEYIGAFIPATIASLHTVDYDLDLLQILASVGGKQPEGHERVLPLPEKGRNKRAADLRAALAKNEALIIIVNQPDQEAGLPEILERFGLKSDASVMMMYLKLESNLIGILGLAAEGLNQYNNEHARLLQLLHEPVAIAMSNALKHREVMRLKDMLADDNRYLFDELRSASGDEIIGSDFGLKAVMRMVRQVAPLDSPVLLLGETGTGKEVIANAIHYSSSAQGRTVYQGELRRHP